MTTTISIRWNADSAEYIVRIGGNRRSDYFANDPIDAIETADSMAEWLQKDGPTDVDITACATTRRRAMKATNTHINAPWLYRRMANTAGRVRFVSGEPSMMKLLNA